MAPHEVIEACKFCNIGHVNIEKLSVVDDNCFIVRGRLVVFHCWRRRENVKMRKRRQEILKRE